MTKKYKLTDQTIEHDGRTLYQIQALIDIPYYSVSKGDLGGYVESEDNLSHFDNAWVADNAKVYHRSHVSCNALIQGEAEVYANAVVSGDARVNGCAKVYGRAHIVGYARVTDYAQVWGDPHIADNAIIRDNSSVCGFARILRNTRVTDEAEVSGDVSLDGNILVGANASIKGEVEIRDHRHFIIDGAVITDENQIFYTKDLTVYKGQDGLMVFLNHYPKHEEFRGQVEEFLAYSRANHDPKTHLEFVLLIEVAKSRILGSETNNQNNQEVLINRKF